LSPHTGLVEKCPEEVRGSSLLSSTLSAVLGGRPAHAHGQLKVRSPGRTPSLRELQDARTIVLACVASQQLVNGFLQSRKLKRLAYYCETLFGCLRHVAVRAGEKDGNIVVAIANFLGKGDTIHSAWHDDVTEYKSDLLASL
jgi:hypothetical protein